MIKTIGPITGIKQRINNKIYRRTDNVTCLLSLVYLIKKWIINIKKYKIIPQRIEIKYIIILLNVHNNN